MRAHLPQLVTLTLACVACGGCASALTDEMANTFAATRPDSVRAMRAAADAAERLPATLERVNGLLGAAGRTSDELRARQDELVGGVAEIASSAALAITRLGALVEALEGATRSAQAILTDAEESAAETRAERRQIVANVAAITSSAQGLLEALGAQNERSRADQDRALHALADLSEGSARAAGELAALSGTAGRLGTRLEPELASAAGSVARILDDTSRLTHALSSEQTATTGGLVASLGGGLLGGALVAALALAVRGAFRRAVAAEVARRARDAEA